MLGQWRIAIKQAEDAARAGRLEEAIALATRPDLAEHRPMVLLRDRLAADLVARGARRAKADDLAGAIDDLGRAEGLGAAADVLASARLAIADGVVDDLRADLESGEPARAFDRVEELARQKIANPSLRRFREAADAWRGADADARRGEFARALEGFDRAARLLGDAARSAIASARAEVEGRRRSSGPAVERLYAAIDGGRWPETLLAAEAVLAIASDHPAARQARAKAWQRIAAIPPKSASASFPAPGAARPDPAPLSPPTPTPEVVPPAPRERFFLWVDDVGGYQVCLDDAVTIGRAGVEPSADVAILGDLSRRHASIARDGDGGYLVRAEHPTFLNGRPVSEAPLKDGDLIRLGSTVELEFRQPSPVSASARLRVVSRHRLPMAVDGVILMADTCIIGSNRQAHVQAPGLAGPVVLFRQGPGLCCRAPGPFEVDGKPQSGRGAITTRSSVSGDGFSFSLEPLEGLSSRPGGSVRMDLAQSRPAGDEQPSTNGPTDRRPPSPPDRPTRGLGARPPREWNL